MSSGATGVATEKFWRMVVKKRNNSVRAMPSPRQIRFPVETEQRFTMWMQGTESRITVCIGSGCIHFASSQPKAKLCLFVACLVCYLQPLMRCLAHSGAQQIWYLYVARYTWCPYRVVPLGCDLGSQAPSRIGVKMRWVNTGKATGTDKLLNEQRPLFDCPQEVMAPALWNAGPAYLRRRA